jgi:hypothetical protein
MRLPVPMWHKTLAALGFRRVRRTNKSHGNRRRFQIESLERREMLTAAPLLDTSAISEQVERGGIVNMSQLVAGVTTYNSLQGIAIVGTDFTHGTLQYSTDSGSTWTNVGTVSSSTALLLGDGSNDELRVEPTDDYIGDLDDAITIRAWDQDTGTDGTYADTTTNGGTSAFSNTTASATVSITPLVGSTISVGSSTNDNDEPPTLISAVDGQGISVVAWQDQSNNLIAQFSNASGALIGSPVQINPSGDGARNAAVSANANGTFAFSWIGSSGVEVQRYQDDSGVVSAVDSSPLAFGSDNDGAFFSVGLTTAGGLVVGWSQGDGDGNESLLVQQTDSDGVATADPIVVTTINTSSYQFNNAQMSVAANGSFAIQWMTTSTGDDDTLYLQSLQFDASGVAQEETPLDIAIWSTSDNMLVTQANITVDGAGGFVSAWLQTSWGSETGLGELMARHFDASGTGGAAVTIDGSASPNYGRGWYLSGNALTSGGGDWAVLWTNGDGNLVGRLYDATDAPVGDAFEIASAGSSGIAAPIAIASNAQGNLVAAWSVETWNDYGTESYAYYAQQLQINLPPTAVTMPAVTAAEGSSSATIDLASYFSDADLPYGVPLSFTASSSNTGAVSTSVSGNLLTLNYSATTTGISTVTVEASDAAGNVVDNSFNVIVSPPAPTLASTEVTQQVQHSGGVLGLSQLVAGVTSFNGQLGIAITGTALSHGTLQYSTDGGTTWTNVGTVSDSNALLLADSSSTELQFIPNDTYVGDADDTITFLAWDQSTGTNGGYVDATTTGGTTGLSTATASASISITPLVGSAISAGSSTADYDEPPTLTTAVDGQGTSVVVWNDASNNLIAQFYNASGVAIGSAVQINPDGDTVSQPSVSANSNGTFAFAWYGSGGLEVQRYSDSEDGIVAIDTSPLVITPNADGNFYNVGVTAIGGLVAGWSQTSTDNSQELLQVQRFNSSGVASSDPMTVATIDNDTDSFYLAQMSVAADGGFALQWMTTLIEDGSQSLQAIQYDAAGFAQEESPLAVANWSPSLLVGRPAITVDGAGGFVSTWTQEDDTTGNDDLMARHFDSSGSAADAFVIDGNASANIFGFEGRFPSQSIVNAGGNWGITWVSATSGNLMSQFFNADDEALGDAFELASPGSAGFGASLALASNAQGDLLAAWSIKTGTETDNYAYYVQQMQVGSPPAVMAAIPDQDVTEDPPAIDLASYFTAPNGDPLSYTATSSDTVVANPSVSGCNLMLTSSASSGLATITVTATDTVTGSSTTTTFNASSGADVTVTFPTGPTTANPNAPYPLHQIDGLWDLTAYLNTDNVSIQSWVVNWGDGSITDLNGTQTTDSTTAQHIYPTSGGNYTITATGTDASNKTYTYSTTVPIPASTTPTASGITAPFGGTWTLNQILAAYGINDIPSFDGINPANGAGQTIAIVDAYYDPDIAQDLIAFDNYFHLAAPPSFNQYFSGGGSGTADGVGFDPTGGWAVETALDIEWAHAIAPGATIDLVVSPTAQNPDLIAAVKYAANLGASVVSMSWGSFPEGAGELALDSTFAAYPNTTFVAATGDNGSTYEGTQFPTLDGKPAGSYPAYSPNVLAVGGTVLSLSGSTYSEVGWSGSGGGASTVEPAPAYQNGDGDNASANGNRTIPDVSFDATNVAVDDYFITNSPSGGSAPWINSAISGTSFATPVWAALIAIADQGRKNENISLLGSSSASLSNGTMPLLYALPKYSQAGSTLVGDFNNIKSGSNGGFSANPSGGYNEVTGIGTPIASQLVPNMAGELIYTAPAGTTVVVKRTTMTIEGVSTDITEILDGNGTTETLATYLPTVAVNKILITGTSNNTVTVDNSGGYAIPAGGVNFKGGTGTNLLTVDDHTDASVANYIISSSMVTVTSGTTTGNVSYSGVSTLTLDGGGHASNTFTLNSTSAATTTINSIGASDTVTLNSTTGATTNLTATGNSAIVNVRSTTPSGTTNITSSGSGAIVNITGTASASTTHVTPTGASTTIYVGTTNTAGGSASTGSLAGVVGNISVAGNSTTSVVLDDKGNTTAGDIYYMNGANVTWGGSFGLSTTLNFTNVVSSLTVYGANTTNTYLNVNDGATSSTAVPLTTNVYDGTGNTDVVNMYDTTTTSEALTTNIFGNNGTGNRINITGTAAGTGTYVSNFGPGTGVYVGTSGTTRNLANILGAVHVTGESATNGAAMYVEDDDATSAITYTVTASSITTSGGLNVSYSAVGNIDIESPTSKNSTFNISGTSAGQTTVNGQGGTTTYNVTGTGSGTILNVSGFGASSNVNITGTASTSTTNVTSSAASTTIYVGTTNTAGGSASTGSLAGVVGNISVAGNSTTSVVLDDKGNTTAGDIYYMNGANVTWGGSFGLSTTLNFTNVVSSLTVYGANTTNTYLNVNDGATSSTAVPLTTNVYDGTGNTDVVNMYDTTTTSEALTTNIFGNNGTGNRINITGTAAGTGTYVSNFGPGTGVYVGTSGTTRNLANILGAVHVTGESATNGAAMYVEDDDATSAITYTVTASSITTSGGLNVSYSAVGNIDIESPTSKNSTFNISGTSAGQTTVNGQGGTTTYNVTGTGSGTILNVSGYGASTNIYLGTTSASPSSGNLGNIGPTINIGGGTSSTAANLYVVDSSNTARTNYTIAPSAITWGPWTSTASAITGTVNLNSAVAAITLDEGSFAGNGRDQTTSAVSTDISGDLVNVSGTEAGTSTTINSGGAPYEFVYLTATTATSSTFVNGFGTNSEIYMGTINNGYRDLDNIHGAISVTGQSGTNVELAVVDQEDTTAHTYQVTGNTVLRDGATIVTYNQVATLYVESPLNVTSTFNVTGEGAGTLTQLNAAGGSDNYYISATKSGSTTAVYNFGASANINIGITPSQTAASGTLAAIAGPITITGDSGKTANVAVDDEASATGDLYVVNTSTVLWDGHTLLSNYTNVGSLAINGSPIVGNPYQDTAGQDLYTGSEFNVLGTSATSTTLNGDGGNDELFNIKATASGTTTNVSGLGTVSEIRVTSDDYDIDSIDGLVNVEGFTESSNNQLYAIDLGGTTSTYALTSSTLSRNGTPVLAYGGGQFALYTADGSTTNVASTAANAFTLLSGGGTFNVTSTGTGSSLAFQEGYSPSVYNIDSTGSGSRLDINGNTSGTPDLTVNIGSNAYQGDMLATIALTGTLEALNVIGNATFSVAWIGAGTQSLNVQGYSSGMAGIASFNVQSGGTYTIAGGTTVLTVAANGTFSQTGSGTLVVNGAESNASGSVYDAVAGTSDFYGVYSPLVINVSSGATFNHL